VSQALTVNSIVRRPQSYVVHATSGHGFTYVLSAMTGAAFTRCPPERGANSAVNSNPKYTDAHAIAMQTNATGSSFITQRAGTRFLVFETNQVQSGAGVNGNNILGGSWD